MKLIKKILMGLGVVFILFIALAIFLTGSSYQFRQKHEQFVRDYTHEFSQSWVINNVSAKTTNDMLQQINTPNGKQAVSIFRSLGGLVEISDMELQNYSTNAGGPTVGVFNFKASFENADTIVTVTVHENDDAVKVDGFHVNPIGDISPAKEITA